MIIFLILSIPIVIFAYCNFKQTFIFYCGLKMIALSAMCIRYEPPALSMGTLLNAFFIFEFWRRGYFKGWRSRYRIFPLRTYFKLSLFSLLMSSIFTIVPDFGIITNDIMIIMDEYILVFMFWIFVNNIVDVRSFLNKAKWILILVCLIGIVEFKTNVNLLTTFLQANVSPDLLFGKILDAGERLDARRVTSLFVSPNNFIYCAFVVLMIYMHNFYLKNKISLFIPFLYLSIALIIMANSRTVLFSSLIILFPIFLPNFSNIRSWIIVFSAIAVFFILKSSFDQYWINITSIFDYSSKNVSGSSTEMRVGQLEASYELFKLSPIFGNGLHSIGYFTQTGDWGTKLFGTESIWFKLLIEKGIFGIIAYIYLFIELQKRYNILNNKVLFFYTTGYLVANTMSSLPGFSMSFLYMGYFVMDIIKRNRQIA